MTTGDQNGGGTGASGGGNAGAGGAGAGATGTSNGNAGTGAANTGTGTGADNSNGQGQQGQQQPNNQQQQGEWKIPDAYKDKPWAGKIKSADDLWKTLDGAQGLIGKKSATLDFKTATPEQIEAHFASTRPADIAAYQWPETFKDADTQKAIGGILSKYGVSDYQGTQIIKDYLAHEKGGIESATSADGFTTEMKKSFGDEFSKEVALVVNGTKTSLSKEDQALINSMPNQYMGVLFRAVRGIQKAYGANDSGANHQDGKGGNVGGGKSIDDQISENTKAINDLTAGPHSQQQKDDLLGARHKLFQQKSSAQGNK